MDIRDLQLVVAIAEEGTVTGAGNRLHLTQSALSHRLKDLEDRLGVPMFLRVRRRMIITPAGESVLASARRVLDEIERVQAQVQRPAKNGHRLLSVSTACCTCYGWLPNLVATFRSRHPQVEIRLDCDLSGQAAEWVASGRSDIGIVYNAPADPSIEAVPLFDDDMVVVVSPQHARAGATAIRPGDLADETLLVYPPREQSTLLNEVLRPAGVHPSAVLEFHSTGAILELAASGLGVGFLARWAAAPYLRLRRLVALPLAIGTHRITWSAISLRNRNLDEFVSSIVASLRQAPKLVPV